TVMSQSRNLGLRTEHTDLFARPGLRRANQKTSHHRVLWMSSPAAHSAITCIALPPTIVGDRDAAGTSETLPRVLPVAQAQQNAVPRRGADQTAYRGSKPPQRKPASTRSPDATFDRMDRSAHSERRASATFSSVAVRGRR